MKLGEIIQRIQSAYSKGVQSDDSRLSSRHIYNKIITTRAKLLRQMSNKKQKINIDNYITLNCVELIEVNEDDCPCVSPEGCKVVRTKHKLPKTISGINKQLIDWVISKNNTIVYSEANKDELRYSKGNRFTNGIAKYLLDNRYMYFYSGYTPDQIKIRMLVEDPWLASKFPSACSEEGVEDCSSPFDMEFPLDADLVDTLVLMSAEELIGLFNQSREDVRNNATDEIVE